jgi:Uma2 family endonuclease
MMTETAVLPDLALRSLDASWNYARWQHLPDDGNRYEVIDGVLYMTTAPSFFHQWIVRQIALTLVEQIDQPSIGLTIWAPIGVLMPGCDPVQPDIVVVRREQLGIIAERRINGVPALLVEVVSPGTLRQDSEIKRAAYARAGVPEYWIVRPTERDVLVHSQPDPALGAYLQTDHVPPDGMLASPTLPVRATVSAFFAGSPDETV